VRNGQANRSAGNLKGSNHLENPGVHGRLIIIKRIFMRENVNWIQLEEDKLEEVRSQVFELYKMRGISVLAERLIVSQQCLAPERVKVTLAHCEMTTCRTVAKFVFIFPQKGDNGRATAASDLGYGIETSINIPTNFVWCFVCGRCETLKYLRSLLAETSHSNSRGIM
jgi:hypothetical protein